MCRPIEHDGQAHHSPDLFPLQHEVSKATSLALARAVRQAEAQERAAEAHWHGERGAEQAYGQRPHGPGRPPAFAQRMQAAGRALAQATLEREQAQARQQEARELSAAFSARYHPYDLQDGQVQPVEQGAAGLGTLWQRLEALAQAADLPARAHEHPAQAKRLTGALVATRTFFFTALSQRLEALNLAPAIQEAVRSQPIPALYLQRVATRSTRAEARHRLNARSARWLEPLQPPSHPIQALDRASRATLEQVAGDCAEGFQRASSALEGRNGQRALQHHGRHRLRDRKLAALRAVHHFPVRRPDATTPANRLFGRAHPPLFEQILERVRRPPAPRQRRARPPRPLHLVPIAA